jgi:hypothetical protein
VTCKIFEETGKVPLECLFKCERGCVHEPFQPPCRVPDADFSVVLTPEQALVEAELLYDECPTVKPAWEQLGEVTKSVWVDMVLAGKRAVLW